MRAIATALGIVILLMAGGCRHDKMPAPKETIDATAAAGRATIEAWETATIAPPPSLPTSTPFPTPLMPRTAGPEVRRCDASDLTGVAMPGENLETMHEGLRINLGNRSLTPCRLSHIPDIQFLDSEGAAIPLEVQQSPLCSDRHGLPYISSSPLLMLPKMPAGSDAALPGQARLVIEWLYDRCSPPAQLATSIRLWLPEGGGAVSIDLPPQLFRGGVAPCYGVEVLDYDGVPGNP
jgi:hypothetical protein